jgi:hypothetical protein
MNTSRNVTLSLINFRINASTLTNCGVVLAPFRRAAPLRDTLRLSLTLPPPDDDDPMDVVDDAASLFLRRPSVPRTTVCDLASLLIPLPLLVVIWGAVVEVDAAAADSFLKINERDNAEVLGGKPTGT